MTAAAQKQAETHYARDLVRAFGGALIFAVPLLMTMEMWWFGFHMDRVRMAVFIAASAPLLIGLAYYAGFSHRQNLLDATLDAFAALAVGAVTASVLLVLVGALQQGDAPRQLIGQVSLQAVPAAIGALLARRQLRGGGAPEDKKPETYAGELFLMVIGALFLALNLAPTEEMVLIAWRASPWHMLALLALSLGVMHVIVYQAGFGGQEEHGRPLTAFFHFTLAGYGLVLLTGLFVLWLFGRTDGQALSEIVATCVVLGFPAGLGAAAARLLV
ncbi:TIGR02587 family membrane protein [Brevundimonas sp. 2R-24]|uniref:TIGR02587 family membrane protein n=1 Tax=Peiella sedimenti TaxID=3061083 RepID=A0ABT8SJ46_9CAUL|nr:TIGR02587 family membrane protein [Caulobacteraceae bacterium XZ-24]